MPRIRSIKPDICTSPTVARVSEAAECMWIKLWTHSDDEGRFRARAEDILATVYASRRSVTVEQVEARLVELQRERLVVLYEHEGKRYGYHPGWAHQKISHKQPALYPAPPEPSSTVPENSGTLRKTPERSCSDENKPENAIPENSGMLRKLPASRAFPDPNPYPDPSPSPEGGPGETAAPLAGWGRHLAGVPVGAPPEAWRCAEAAFAAWYRQRRRLPWKASAASGRALRGLAVAIADTAAATGLTEEAVIDRALTNFGADPFAVTSDFPPALLETKWGAYFDPPEIPRPKGAMHPCPPPGAHGNDLADQLGLEVANG